MQIVSLPSLQYILIVNSVEDSMHIYSETFIYTNYLGSILCNAYGKLIN